MRPLTTLLVTLAMLLVAAAPAPFPDEIPLPDGFQPEGVAVGPGTTFYAGALFAGDLVSGDLRDGTWQVVDAPDGRQAAGLAVDERHGLLFVAGGFTGAAYVYDTATFETVAAWEPLAKGGIVNDVIVTRQAAYLTNSLAPELYRVPISANGALGAPERITVSGAAADDFLPTADPNQLVVNLNGIEATHDGGTLVSVHTHSGALFTIDPATGRSHRIKGLSVPTADGIVLRGRTLYVVQNGFLSEQPAQIAVVRLDEDLAAGQVVRVLRDERLRVPTTAALAGNRLVVANARLDQGLPAPADTEFELVTLPADPADR